jgi:hypothetical protein
MSQLEAMEREREVCVAVFSPQLGHYLASSS